MKSNSTSGLSILILLLSVSMSAMAISKKEAKQQRREIMERLISLSHNRECPLASFMTSDEAAYNYCDGILGCTEETYSKDTAAVNRRLNEDYWIMNHQEFLTPKEEKKYKNYDPQLLSFLYAETGRELWEIEARYKKVTQYCNQMLQLRREAGQRTMPSGPVKRLVYEEYETTLPESCFFKLERDTVSGQMMLSGHSFNFRHGDNYGIEVGEDVLQHVRSLLEQHKVYQELGSHPNPPRFSGRPEPTGGPASWYFKCELEGGTIFIDTIGQRLRNGCLAIIEYLEKLLIDSCQTTP